MTPNDCVVYQVSVFQRASRQPASTSMQPFQPALCQPVSSLMQPASCQPVSPLMQPHHYHYRHRSFPNCWSVL